MSEWSLPRSTSSLAGDWIAAARAWNQATTDDQRAAVRVRVESLVARRDAGEINEWEHILAELAAAAQVWFDEVRAALAAYYPVLEEAVRRFAEAYPLAYALEEARQERRQATSHTGPALPPLDPRRRR